MPISGEDIDNPILQQFVAAIAPDALDVVNFQMYGRYKRSSMSMSA